MLEPVFEQAFEMCNRKSIADLKALCHIWAICTKHFMKLKPPKLVRSPLLNPSGMRKSYVLTSIIFVRKICCNWCPMKKRLIFEPDT